MMHPASADLVQKIPDYMGNKRAKNNNKDEIKQPLRQVSESEGWES